MLWRYSQRPAAGFPRPRKPGAQNCHTGSVKINDAAEVGEGSNSVILGGCANSANARLGSRRVERGINRLAIIVAVTSCGCGEEAGVNQSLGGVVDTLRWSLAERHADNNTVGAVSVGRIMEHSIHTGNDGRSSAC
ncbi:hypothetical protein HG530_009274 [Fusarium avenaceum]|nr:hypothetical protein HG530_009274 [Fusarium avenaceum]